MAAGSTPTPLTGEEALAQHVAEISGISLLQAKDLIHKYGNDLKKIEEAAKLYSSRS